MDVVETHSTPSLVRFTSKGIGLGDTTMPSKQFFNDRRRWGQSEYQLEEETVRHDMAVQKAIDNLMAKAKTVLAEDAADVAAHTRREKGGR